MELRIFLSKSELPSENYVNFFLIESKMRLIIHFYVLEAISSLFKSSEMFFSYLKVALSKVVPAGCLENSPIS